MRTIPRRIPKNWPKGTYRACCDYCGATFMRHMLIRKEGGLLACKSSCAKGKDEVQLDRENAQHAAQVYKNSYPYDGGRVESNTLPTIQRMTAEDITRYRS